MEHRTDTDGCGVITAEMYFAEIDKLRNDNDKPYLTDEQFKCIQYARDNVKPLTWPKLAAWWEKTYGEKVAYNTLMGRYSKEIRRRETVKNT